MHTLLLIDDDERMAPLLADFFTQFQLTLINETHPQKGLERLEQQEIDLVILDIMLPDMDGFEVCRQIRKTSSIPILMLTGRGDVMDRVIGLELGADDYLAKPYEPRELVARIHNILKRQTPIEEQETTLIKHGLLSIDKSTDSIIINGKPINLTTKEIALLYLLADSPGKHFSRDDILNALSGIDAEFYSRSVDILVSRLRQKIQPLEYIQTVWGKGYKFIVNSDALDATANSS